jgi:DNA ligase 1
VKYSALAAFFDRLERTPGRLEMTAILVELLQEVPRRDIVAVVRLLSGQVAPDWEGLESGLAEKQILKALALAQGGSSKSEEALARLERLYQEKGDLGLAAEAVVGGKGKRQASLFGAEALTVAQVFHTVQDIARTTGAGSQEGKQRLLSKLLLDAGPLEARYITRMVAGRLRLGVADMTFLDALAAWHLGKGVKSVTERDEAERAELESIRRRLERAYDVRSDLAVVADTIATGGMAAIDALEVEIGVPLRPMASERLKTFGEILEKMRGRVHMEYKYDGLRMQVHVPARPTPRTVRIFSRRLEEMTQQFPEVVAAVCAHVQGPCIIEGEGVALDEDGRLLHFQEVSRRRGRKTDIAQVSAEVPITLFLFDCLAIGGKSVMDRPLEARRELLAGLVDAPKAKGGKPDAKPSLVRLSTLKEARDEKGLERFFDEAVEDGAEGIMCKDPEAPYKAGSRGFAWVKFKTDYTEALVDTMGGVVWRSPDGGLRRGRAGVGLRLQAGHGVRRRDAREPQGPIQGPGRQGEAGRRRFRARAGRLVRAGYRHGSAGGGTDAQPDASGGLGALPPRFRAGGEVPEVHGPVAHRQGAQGCHDGRGAGVHVREEVTPFSPLRGRPRGRGREGARRPARFGDATSGPPATASRSNLLSSTIR